MSFKPKGVRRYPPPQTGGVGGGEHLKSGKLKQPLHTRTSTIQIHLICHIAWHADLISTWHPHLGVKTANARPSRSASTDSRELSSSSCRLLRRESSRLNSDLVDVLGHILSTLITQMKLVGWKFPIDTSPSHHIHALFDIYITLLTWILHSNFLVIFQPNIKYEGVRLIACNMKREVFYFVTVSIFGYVQVTRWPAQNVGYEVACKERERERESEGRERERERER
ncbi:hypothetical protein J6590_021510 [Homalodisca vitripennis]|nr:hypothetical protein J6590_021510 [Homalodisca vitripennis]